MSGSNCPGCGARLLSNGTCAACGGEAVEPQRAAAMRAALGDDVFKGVHGMSRTCSFCDGAMMRQSAVKITVDVCTACGAWFLDRGERERLGNLADAKARGVDLTPAPPPPKPLGRRQPTVRDHIKLGATVAASLSFVLFLIFTVVMAAWGYQNRDASAGRCTTHCDCAGDDVCLGGQCERMMCQTGVLSTRDCPAGLRCVKTNRFMTEYDRERFNGVCRSESSCRTR